MNQNRGDPWVEGGVGGRNNLVVELELENLTFQLGSPWERLSVTIRSIPDPTRDVRETSWFTFTFLRLMVYCFSQGRGPLPVRSPSLPSLSH